MKNMTKKTTRIILISIALTFVLVGAVVLGVGAIRNSRGNSVSSADEINLGDFTVPASNGTLGSATNPYVVLEVVPSEDMAQFGYLVAGQEPIDLDAIPADKLAEVQELISTQLSVSSTGYGTPFMAGFYTDVRDLLDKYSDKQSKANQYGKYVYHETDDQEYDLVADNSVGEGGKVFVSDSTLSSYAFVESFDPDEFGTPGITISDVPIDQVIAQLPNRVEAPKLYDPAGHPLVYNTANGEYFDTLYVERTPGTGSLSDEKYEKIQVGSSAAIAGGTVIDRTHATEDEVTAQSPLGGLFSFDYKYVGEGNGNLEYGPIGGGEGEGEGIKTGKQVSKLTLEATGFYMDMSGSRLYTEETEDTEGKDQLFRFERDGALNNGTPLYNIYTGSSDYEKVLTASLTAGDTYYVLTNGSRSVKVKAQGTGTRGRCYLLTEESGYKKALWVDYETRGSGRNKSYVATVSSRTDYNGHDEAVFYTGGGKFRSYYFPTESDYLSLGSNGSFSITGSSSGTNYTERSEYSGYLYEDTLAGTNQNQRVYQRFALEPYTLNGEEYTRIYITYDSVECYFTGRTGEEQIDLLSDKYISAEKTESIPVSYVYDEAGVNYLVVKPELVRNASVDGANRDIYYLYTKSSEYKQALTYNNNQTLGLSENPGTTAEFYLYTDPRTNTQIYCTVSENSSYRYLFRNNSGQFELSRTYAMPGDVTMAFKAEKYLEIKGKGTSYSHVLKMVSAGTDSSGHQLYYLYTDTSGFQKILYITSNNLNIEQNLPASDDNKYKFYIDNGEIISADSGSNKNGRYLYLNSSGAYTNGKQGNIGAITELGDNSNYCILSDGTTSGVIKLTKYIDYTEYGGRLYYKVQTAKSGFTQSLYADRDGRYYYLFAGTGSGNAYLFYVDNNNKLVSYQASMLVQVDDSRACGFDVYSESDYVISSCISQSFYQATITNDTDTATLKAVPASGTNEYYLYTGAPAYNTQIYYNNGNVGQQVNGRRTDNEAVFLLVEEDGHTYLKVKATSASLPYLYVDGTEVKFTKRLLTIPGRVDTGRTDNILRKNYIGFQLFKKVDEDEIIKAYFRYILNGGDMVGGGTKGRYLEVKSVNGAYRLVQGSETINPNSKNQIFAFVETGKNTGKYYIYTGRSGYTKVLTLNGTSESSYMVEANIDKTSTSMISKQTFSLYQRLSETAGNINNSSDYQRIRTNYQYSYTTGGIWGWGGTTHYVDETWTIEGANYNNKDNYGNNINPNIVQYRDHKLYEDKNNAYNQWFKLVEVDSTASLGFYEKAGGSFVDVSGETLLYPVSTGNGYVYKNETNKEQKIKVAATGKEYTLKPKGQSGDRITLYLGDYDQTYDGERGPIFFEKVEGQVYGNFNFSKYIFTTIAGGYKYAFTMSKLTGENAGKGHYEWIGYTYEQCYGSSKIVTDTTQYPASVSVLVGLESGGLRITEEDKKTKYNELKSCQEATVYTLYEGGSATTSADSFKKYAIGLAYVDGDYSKGLADIDYNFDGWYTDPNCMYKFNPETALTKNTTLYARWECISPQEVTYKVSFDCNAYEKEADGVTYKLDSDNKRIPEAGMATATMPATVEKVRKGNKITAPEATPIRSGYIFTGWFDDEDCVWESEAEYVTAKNAGKKSHDFTKGVTKETVLYAGWTRLSPTDVYTIEFNGNATYTRLPSAQVVSVPAIVTNYARNGRLCTIAEDGSYNYSDITLTSDFCDSSTGVMVPIVPELRTAEGGATEYVFAGWYYYATCEDDYRFDFNTTVTDRVHVVSRQVTVPDGEGTKTITARTITLYAKWVKKTDLCTVSFNTNIPAGSPAAERVPSPISVEYGKAIGQEQYQDLVSSYQTSRKSDVQVLLDDYHVKVITVTPDDLNKASGDNLKLVDRANMIVINQTCSNKMRELWQNDTYRRASLFPKDRAYYANAFKAVGDSSKVKTFVQKDFNWATTMRIFNKVAGVGTSAVPVVFDYTAYTNALAKAGKEVTTRATYSDSETITNTGTGSNNNVYKLYLMTQQMNPITLYNAYINDNHNQNNTNELGSSDGKFNAGWLNMTFTGENTTTKNTYWSKYTLVPYNAMTEADHKRDGLGVIGVSDKPEMSQSSIDSTMQKTAQLRNRVLLFNSQYNSTSDQAANMVSAFETLTYESIGENELNNYMCPTSVAPTSYKTADIMYYMIRNTGMYTNFTKNLSVLEIEAGDSWKDSSYWFWYISRYVPNYTGTSMVTTQSTYELVGDNDDLNAAYDVIYFGVNLDPRLDSYYKKTMPGETRTARYNIGDIVPIELGQTISADFYRPYDASTNVIKAIDLKNVLAAGVDGYERINNIPWAIECKVEGTNCTPQLFEPNVGALQNTYGLKVDFTRLTSAAEDDNSIDTYRYYDKDNDKSYYFSKIAISSTYKTSDGTVNITRPSVSEDDENYVAIKSSWHEAGNADNSSTVIMFREKGTAEWRKGYIQLDEFASKVTSEYTENLIWNTDQTAPQHATLYPAGSYAYAGEKIKLAGYLTSQISTGNIYLYAHIGAIVSTKDTRLGIFDAAGGANDDLNQFAYSGNDITKSKYGELIDFVRAGYPVIVCSNLLNVSKEVDTKKVDSSSYIYKFLTELRTNYPSSFYIDNDTTRDDQFVTSLKNKTFELEVIDKPTEYVDRTYEDPSSHTRPYASFTEDKIYVNGAANGSNANINNRDLTFQIYIDSTKPSGYYKLRLYIDTNADGRFDEEEERLDTLEISVTATGRTANTDRLLGNTNYTINRRVVEYAGILPWKLEIIDGENELIHDYVLGECAIKVEEKEKINVLQIIPDSGVNVYLPTDGEYKAAKKLRGSDINESNASTYFKNVIRNANSNASTNTGTGKVTTTQLIKNAGMFYYYTTLLNEFEVHFSRMSVTEFKRLVTTGKAPNEIDVNEAGNIVVIDESGNTYLDEAGDCTYFDDKGINMLILGYADCYTDIESDTACEYIEDFISAGNTTLFTHDTTSFVNKLSKVGFNGTSDIWWGYYINKYFRDILGMDRFGVMTNRGTYDSNAPDWPFKVNTNQTQYAIGSATKTKNKLLNQGLTNVCVGQDGARITKTTKTNDGQIVNYPFRIPDELSVASTHSQYYQLNLDAEDIVVWYCLTDKNSTFYATKNDVRNNYYIYNRGNITYSGVGHSSDMTTNEYKLFVNTMIAAYQASSIPTEPVITNRDRSVDTGTDYLYVDYDATIGGSEARPFGEEISEWTVTKSGDKISFSVPAADVDPNCYTKEVHFTLKNYSIILNKRMTVHYYPVVYDAAGNRIVLEDCPLDLTTYEYDDVSETWQPLTEANGGVVHLIKTEVVNVKNGVTFEPIVRISQPDEATFNATVNVKDTVGVDMGAGVRRYTSITKMTGSIVDSLKSYYVPVPISDIYYNMLQSDEYKRIIKEKTGIEPGDSTISNFSLDTNNHFEIEIRVIMRYGREPDKCVPLIGTRGAVFMRRGMFKLD